MENEFSNISYEIREGYEVIGHTLFVATSICTRSSLAALQSSELHSAKASSGFGL